jgi:hypothetical protein
MQTRGHMSVDVREEHPRTCAYASSSISSDRYLEDIICHQLNETQLVALCISEAFLRTVVTEKRMSLIKAWEEKEKAKAENRQVVTLCDAVPLSISHFTHGA